MAQFIVDPLTQEDVLFSGDDMRISSLFTFLPMFTHGDIDAAYMWYCELIGARTMVAHEMGMLDATGDSLECVCILSNN